jgi:hypothetical protein
MPDEFWQSAAGGRPANPTSAESKAIQMKVEKYQEIFDTH